MNEPRLRRRGLDADWGGTGTAEPALLAVHLTQSTLSLLGMATETPAVLNATASLGEHATASPSAGSAAANLPEISPLASPLPAAATSSSPAQGAVAAGNSRDKRDKSAAPLTASSSTAAASSSSSSAAAGLEVRVGHRYRLVHKIGSGSFGDVYVGVDTATQEEVGVKLESAKSKHPQLQFEAKVYKLLAGAPGIPSVLHCALEGDYHVMVMELLGPSLEDLFTAFGRRFSLKTVLMLADQLIRRLEHVHAKHYLHRDVKPDNFLMGRAAVGALAGQRHTVYLIDFGLAKKYSDSRTLQHIPLRQGKQLTGTARYTSLNTHIGLEQSRRDDLESLGYVLLYFLRGSLPWQGLKAHTKTLKYQRIADCKLRTPLSTLTAGLPNEFRLYLDYCRALSFEARPDYAYLRRLFRDLLVRQGYDYDFQWDWVTLRLDEPPRAIKSAPASLGDDDSKDVSDVDLDENEVGEDDDDVDDPDIDLADK